MMADPNFFPPLRAGHRFVESGGSLYMMGGWGEFSLLFSLGISQHLVSKVCCDILNFSVCRCTVISIFPGEGGSYRNDLHVYQSSSFSWTPIPTRGEKPRPRGWHSLAAGNNNTLVLFGGYAGEYLQFMKNATASDFSPPQATTTTCKNFMSSTWTP